MKFLRSIPPLFALLGLLGCSDSPSVGGGGFEGETVALNGVVRMAGRAVSGASVRLLDLRTQSSLGRTATDGEGRFRLWVDPRTRAFLEVRSGDSALVRRLVETVGDDTLALEASRPSTWSARLEMSGSPVASATVRIVGSTESVKTSAEGAFALQRSGAAVEWVDVALPDGSRRQARLPPATGSVLAIPDHPSILLDDFEGPGTRTALGWATGGGWWFALTDSVSGGTSFFEETGLPFDPRLGYVADADRGGTVLRVRFFSADLQSVRYGMVGIALSGAGLWTDLSKVDSISFLAKGVGSARLAIGTRTGLEPDSDPVGHFGTTFDIPAAWTRMVVRREEIEAPPGNRASLLGIPWSEDARRSGTLFFSFPASAELALDDIVLHGPGLSDLVPGP